MLKQLNDTLAPRRVAPLAPRRAALVPIACAALLCASPPAAAQRVVEDIRPLLVEAIRLGTAQGILGGAAAEFSARTFGAYAPIYVDVRRVEALPLASSTSVPLPDGCARVEVTTRQAGVVEPKTHEPEPGEPTHNPPTDQKLVYQINFCENGHLPEQGGGRL